jgi:hypothetical protein
MDANPAPYAASCACDRPEPEVTAERAFGRPLRLPRVVVVEGLGVGPGLGVGHGCV